ncbi:DNA primase [Altererythrobacter aquiaggeris]|uniref:DNA primase n=1 Tax=Aestuarierythrobacter aquiaggeris TaxID=1898396 RepID=UPI00301A103E
MALSPQWLDELRARTTLSTLISRTTKLQKAGHEWKACCPFHDEKSPSFTVSDQKGFYHCFGCGAHGDAIRWMTDQRGLAFMDAVKELAAEAGIEVPAADPRQAQRAEQRASLHDVMADAQSFFEKCLLEPVGEKAREYLDARGFGQHTAQRFGFGFTPDSRNAVKQALSQHDQAMLVECGLQIAVDDREPYDRFRGRLMLPIHDARGRVIAFGGRILDAQKKDAPKYLNSPDTPLFDKGRTLYNLHRAGPASRQTRRMVVVEGYMDVIALAAADIPDAVAPLGTALTERQLELLWRMVDVPVLCFDGDAAGQRAAMRAVTRALPMLQPGRSLSIVRLPGGMDPDDVINRRGVKALEALLAKPASLLDTLWEYERDAQPLDTPEAKAGLKQRLIEHTEAIEQQDIRSLYRRDLLDRFSEFAFPPRQQREFKPHGGAGGSFQRGKQFQPAKPRLSPQAAARLRAVVDGGARDTLSAAVFAGLLRFPSSIEQHSEALARLARSEPGLAPAIESLFEAAEALDPAGVAPISDPVGPSTPPDNTRFTFLMEGTDPGAARDDLAEAVGMLVERPALAAALAAATQRFETDPEGAFAEQQRLLKRKLAFESRLGQMAGKRALLGAQESNSPEGPDSRPEGSETD